MTTAVLTPVLGLMVPMVWCSVVTSLVLAVCTLAWRLRYSAMKDPASSLPLPPGSLGWPIVGETVQFVVQGAQFYVDHFKRYGPIYKTHLLGSPTARVSGAEHLHHLLNSEPQSLTMKLPGSVRHMMGKASLVTSKGDDHVRMKKIILEAFTTTRLSDYLPCVQQNTQRRIKSWCGQGRILGFQACEQLIVDLVLELVLGCRLENDRDGSVRKAVMTINNNLFCVPLNIPGGGFYKASKARAIISEFVLRRLADKGDKEHVSMLEVFLAAHHTEVGAAGKGAGQGLTAEEIVDNAISLMIAGTGTTSGALCCLLLLLGQHPEVVEEIREELNTAGLLSPDGPGELSYDVLQTLEFTQSVIKESLRLHTPAGGAFRKAEKPLEVAGYHIPKDWTVVYSIRDTHKSSKVFKDVSEFKPSRWQDAELSERLHRENPCHYMPFGRGPRACVGKALATMEMTVFLVELCRLATFELHNPDADMVFLPVTKPADDLPVTFYARKEKSN
ncbi:cytochrome P450 26A1 isoform X2 [Aplysia californica]|uniref:Cytochrome P450 26A1 isoform X2 n=1 Tax=Aplysia californica TaxID=6500 RepID=A0ABM0JNZ3_APLCA|nr:cytochrome P450 26A1 isoform X2 [Aplysia californica]